MPSLTTMIFVALIIVEMIVSVKCADPSALQSKPELEAYTDDTAGGDMERGPRLPPRPYRKPTLMPLCDIPLPRFPTPMPTSSCTVPSPTRAPTSPPYFICFWPLQRPSNSPINELMPLRSEITYETPGTVPDTPVDNMI